ncbi:hypothetical protein PW52_06265 [Tamlana sedimentorum]|uniref:Uncharacterized protein n=1 Tax=Neotamlana sedimentorum TaxID=1435349 RepID=A0A0D7WAM2_9FLAO|nr:hypothetical protein [Tamlana sedimentorum]KJD36201.1 hypothetical protein PW52_06265 [Tamlana sedimentorum]
MKALLSLVLILSFEFVVAQPGGGGMMGGGGMRGGGQGGQQNQERQEMPEFDAAKVAGIFNYDDAEVLKKIKLKKKEESLTLEVRKAINTYNVRVNEIALLNKDNFDTLNVYVKAVRESQQANRGQNQSFDRSEQDREDDPRFKVMELVKEKTEPVKALVVKEEDKLNQKMQTLLDEKKYNKWLDYQAEIKEELNPKRPERNDSGMQGGGRQGGRQGGGGGMMGGGF